MKNYNGGLNYGRNQAKDFFPIMQDFAEGKVFSIKE